MTAAEWMAGTDPWPMLEFLERRASDRKLQLFAAACCRRAWSLSTDPRHREAVEAAERSADGLLSEAEFAEVMQPVIRMWASPPPRTGGRWGPFGCMTGATRHLEGGGGYAAHFAACGLASLQGKRDSPPWSAAYRAEGIQQCILLRDIFGDPSRPFRFDPAWLAGEGAPAGALARRIDEAGRYDEIPMLADALGRAGCVDDAALDHCRSPGPHIRGCWVLDALLGRESAVRVGLTTQADWRSCADPEPLLHFLQGKGTERKWRLYAVACCRRIDYLFADERSRRAVEVAARYAEGNATATELGDARAAAQEVLSEARHANYQVEAEENFCMTPRYAAFSCRLHAAEAARSAVGRDVRVPDAEPGTYDHHCWHPSDRSAAAAAQKAVRARLDGEVQAEEVAEAADQVERRAHCDLLRDLFGDCFGPTGAEHGWVPIGRGHLDGWCALPSTVPVHSSSEWMTRDGGTIRDLARAIEERERFENLPALADALEAAGCDESAILDHLRGPGPHAPGCWALDSVMAAIRAEGSG